MSIMEKPDSYEVCPCRHVTKGDIVSIIKKENIKTLKELCEKANAGNKCGGCREMLDQLLEEVNKAH